MPPSAAMTIERLDSRVKVVEDSVLRQERTTERIADAVERLVILETQHAETRESINRAFQAIKAVDERLSAANDCAAEVEKRVIEVEKRMPTLNYIATGVGLVVLGALSAIGVKLLATLGLSV